MPRPPLRVRATVDGRTVPMEGAPRRHIGPDPVEVPRSAYYLRQIRDGDLEEVAPAAPRRRRTEGEE